jgi:hypothetical protein
LSDTDAAFMGIALAMRLKKETKIRRWIEEWYKGRPQYTNESTATDLMLSEPNC